MAKKHIAFDTIAGFESFRSKPYWDENHWRVGYGSDTYVGTDGRVHTVKKKTRVTREQADADLNRRIAEAEKGVIREIGQEAWDKLSDGARIATLDTAYNYGSIGGLKTLKKALTANDPEKIAAALEKYGNEHGPFNDSGVSVNKPRRQKMADMVREEAAGHPIPKVNVGETDVASEVDIGTKLPYMDVGDSAYRPQPYPGRPAAVDKVIPPTPRSKPMVKPTAPIPATPTPTMQNAREKVPLYPSTRVADPLTLPTLDPVPMAGQQQINNPPKTQPQSGPKVDASKARYQEAKGNVQKAESWQTFPQMSTTGAPTEAGDDMKAATRQIASMVTPKPIEVAVKPPSAGIRKAVTVGTQGAGATQMPAGAKPKSVTDAEKTNPALANPTHAVVSERDTRLEQKTRMNPAIPALIATGAVPATALPSLEIAPTPMPSRPLTLDQAVTQRKIEPHPVEVVAPAAPIKTKTVTKTKTVAKPIQKPVSNLTASGRTRASAGETADSVWNEARGITS